MLLSLEFIAEYVGVVYTPCTPLFGSLVGAKAFLTTSNEACLWTTLEKPTGAVPTKSCKQLFHVLKGACRTTRGPKLKVINESESTQFFHIFG